jgi:hypothetical protein
MSVFCNTGCASEKWAGMDWKYLLSQNGVAIGKESLGEQVRPEGVYRHQLKNDILKGPISEVSLSSHTASPSCFSVDLH